MHPDSIRRLNRDLDESSDDDSPKTEPYAPPRIVESARFETVALGCDYDLQCIPTPSGL